MKVISLNKNPTPWQKHTKNAVKVTSLNCAGLKPNFTDVQSDEHLLKADIIHLIETSIGIAEEDQHQIKGCDSHFINIGNGKGIATYYKPDMVEHQQDVKETNM